MQPETLLTMSKQELNRVEIMQKLAEKRMTQATAADLLHISVRQIKRLLSIYRQSGASGLISNKRGKPSNNRLPDSVKELCIALISKHYYDFGPTLAQEKLFELHQINVSVATLHTWMSEAGIWVSRARRAARAYQPRYRRDCYGELIQLDGSIHPWFEERGPKSTLLVYVDDATSKLMMAKFVASESTFTYFDATKDYLLKHGKPIAFYSDKHGVFRVNAKTPKDGERITQFGRALQDLNMDIICANTCQAKGRVERANRTLQDRLVKELRLQNISTVKSANEFLPTFIESYNRKFAKIPQNVKDLHRSLSPSEIENLEEVFSWHEDRTLSNNLTLQYDKVLYIIEDSIETRKLVRKRVTVVDYYDGSIKIKHNGQDLPYRKFDKIRRVNPGAIVENDRLGDALSHIKRQQDLQAPVLRSKSCPKRAHLKAS